MSTVIRTIEEVPLDAIRDHPHNLRREVGDVRELAESMKTFGVLEPIVLAPALDEEGGLVLIAGHRRRAAARQAGLSTIPAEILRSESMNMSSVEFTTPSVEFSIGTTPRSARPFSISVNTPPMVGRPVLARRASAALRPPQRR